MDPRRAEHSLATRMCPVHEVVEGTSELNRQLAADYPNLLKVLGRHCRQHVEPVDILHEAMRITIEHHRAGRVVCVLRVAGYVYRVALNLLRNHRRAFSSRLRYEADIAAMVNQASTPALVHAQMLSRHVLDAFEQLRSERDRTIIKRHYLADENKTALCRELGVTPASFDKLAYRARRRLRCALLERGVSEHDVTFVVTRDPACLGQLPQTLPCEVSSTCDID